MFFVVLRGLEPPGNVSASFAPENITEFDMNQESSEQEFMEEEKEQEANDHNYTECCKRSNVSVECRGFCSVRNILQGSTGREPEACELDFPAIVR